MLSPSLDRPIAWPAGSGPARYDGQAEWYDQTFSAFHPPGQELAFLQQALGTGHGQVCIDLACGTRASLVVEAIHAVVRRLYRLRVATYAS